VDVHHDQVWVVLPSQVEPHPALDGLEEPHLRPVGQDPLDEPEVRWVVLDAQDGVDAADGVAEIARYRGQQFDPEVVDAFLGICEEAAVDLGRGSAA
jgi:hypothetical protein